MKALSIPGLAQRYAPDEKPFFAGFDAKDDTSDSRAKITH